MAVVKLCPGCARAPQRAATGLCEGCHEEFLRQQYAEDDHWQKDAQQAFWRDRQRRSRDRKRLRPTTPLAADADPLDVLERALQNVPALEAACMTSAQQAALDDLVEAFKEVAWGPEAD